MVLLCSITRRSKSMDCVVIVVGVVSCQLSEYSECSEVRRRIRLKNYNIAKET